MWILFRPSGIATNLPDMTTTHTIPPDNTHQLASLRRHWAGVIAVWGIVVILFYLYLRGSWPFAHRWLGITAVSLIWCGRIVWQNLSQNHPADSPHLFPTFGLGTLLTLWRGLALSMVAGFLLSPWPNGFPGWLPALLYASAGIADYLDGYVARITHHTTVLGAQLDMEFDSLGMLAVILLAIWYGQLPWWYLGLGLARYLFLAGLWWRQRRGLPVYDLPPSAHRRMFAGFQMGFLSVVLWPIVPAAGATIAGTIFGLASATGFGRDWLVASGRIDVNSAVYRRRMHILSWLVRGWLPVLARLLLLLAAWMIWQSESHLHWMMLFAEWGWPMAAWWGTFWLVIGGVGITAVSLGLAGRIGALLLLFPVSWDIMAQGLLGANSLALITDLYLLIMSTGFGSLWQVEETFMTRRFGR